MKQVEDRFSRYTPANHPDSLSEALWSHFKDNRQNMTGFRSKMKVWMKLDKEICYVFPDSRTLAFGSTLSGFGSAKSDMDLCIFTNHVQDVGQNKKQREEVNFLHKVRNLIR